MTKRVLQCEYCRHIITENDFKCPACGADCSKIIKKYKEEQYAHEEEQKRKVQEETEKTKKAIAGATKRAGIFGLIVFLIIFVIAIVTFVLIFTSIYNSMKNTDSSSDEVPELEEMSGDIGKSVSLDNYKITVNSYEAYAYYDDFFTTTCNTSEGYQKVAFNFTIENISDSSISTFEIINSISLKADGEVLSKSNLTEDTAYCELIQGKSSYSELASTSLASNDYVKGYLGYKVPTNVKTLTFIIGEDITVEIDNPVYSE